MTTPDTLHERLVYARERLANAERIGRPAHIARCRQRVEGLEVKVAAAGYRECSDCGEDPYECGCDERLERESLGKAASA